MRRAPAPPPRPRRAACDGARAGGARAAAARRASPRHPASPPASAPIRLAARSWLSLAEQLAQRLAGARQPYGHVLLRDALDGGDLAMAQAFQVKQHREALRFGKPADR